METMKQFITKKTKNNGIRFGDRLADHTEDGVYMFKENGFWTGGFWTGLNWLCYEMTGEEVFMKSARGGGERLRKRVYEAPGTLDHDAGFLYCLSFVADYKLTGNEEAKRTALAAADLLKSRFNEAGKFIQAWNVWVPGEAFSEENRGRIIIDCMYNLPLLFWATEVTGDESYREVATAHAQTCAGTIIRPDYTTFHTYVFDPVNGEPKYGRTFQGYSDDSCWSRGQTWAMGGFTYAYKYTQNPFFLEMARKCTDVFLAKIGGDDVPFWDFDLPSRLGEPRDTSAAAIAAASMLELAAYVPAADSLRYREKAKSIVDTLFHEYSTRHNPQHEGLLEQACSHKPENSQTNCSLIYGDYYFAEAVARLANCTKAYW
ncbi:glycoside hydrolase family 88 protein [Paenibacillus roseipurpureus]|uniref:Glycoside hydrolase family 88 protein n=1 Tax=Paenibacillus roseopurpureus TaxID=2918901 RepID=A0AA96LU37_9BACL|nr:glycoside hydrolase family 88 protein [Paenibacillus sp. MBLB1832]WNR46104.1 glycoside hydrolase family 88 protein [Paenibacillus sp. MBLB1832]